MTACSPAPAQDRMLSVTALPSSRTGRVAVEVVGEVDTFTAPLLDACLHSQATRTGVGHLVVDLRRVSFLSGEGVQAMARAERLCRRRGARFSVRRGTGSVQHAHQLTGLGDLVSVDPSASRQARDHRGGRGRGMHGGVTILERAAS